MVQLKKDVYWVGAVDWDIKNFHGYITHRGTSYNSYLLKSEKIALIDSVKAPFYETWKRHISQYVEPSKIDYIISNHSEPDHSGTLAKFHKEEAPQAIIISTERGRNILKKYYGEFQISTIKDTPQLSIGEKTLNFVAVPMAHWPDSMVSYVPEDKLLLSNDAFGQHLSSTGRFDDEVDQQKLWQEAEAYYANILMPLHRPVSRAINALNGLPIDIIAPSHGVIWRKDIAGILNKYNQWVNGHTISKVVIAYDSMWNSTKNMAYAIAEGVASQRVECRVYNLTANHRSDIMTDILEAKAVLVGSPTLNNHVYPSVSEFLSYLRGLRPLNKIGASFGSFGWGGGAKRYIDEQLKLSGIELIENDLDFNFKPNENEWQKAYQYGVSIANKIKE
jgi:flavorubredoxin